MGFGQWSPKKEIFPSIKVQHQITTFLDSAWVNERPLMSTNTPVSESSKVCY